MILSEDKVNQLIDERLRKILGDVDVAASQYVEKYARETLKGASLVAEPQDLIAHPGSDYVIFQHAPRTPCLVGGYIDLAGLEGSDTFKLKIELKLDNHWKWRVYEELEFKGVQNKPIYFFRDIFVVSGVKITLTQVEGIGKHIYHVWYKRR